MRAIDMVDGILGKESVSLPLLPNEIRTGDPTLTRAIIVASFHAFARIPPFRPSLNLSSMLSSLELLLVKTPTDIDD